MALDSASIARGPSLDGSFAEARRAGCDLARTAREASGDDDSIAIEMNGIRIMLWGDACYVTGAEVPSHASTGCAVKPPELMRLAGVLAGIADFYATKDNR